MIWGKACAAPRTAYRSLRRPRHLAPPMAFLAALAVASPAWSGAQSIAAPGATPQPSSSSFELALRFEHGEGMRQDYGRALELYCEAASQGDVRAYFNLGWMYANGRGVARDGAIAAGWWRKAADGGLAEAANLVSLLSHTPAAAQLGCPAPEPAPAGPAAKAPAEIRRMVQSIAPAFGLDSGLVVAVIAAESAFDAHAVSKKNAKGLMQLMPETAARFGVRDPFDPRENIRGGTEYLRFLLQRFAGDVSLALAAYNAGEANVALYGGVPPFEETIQYIDRVKRLYGFGDRLKP